MSSVYYVGMVCYASSHDDFVGVFSSKELADAAVLKLNKEYRERCNLGGDENSDWTNPYYSCEYDVTEFDGYKNNSTLFTKWTVAYCVPSVGRFKLFPTERIAIEKYELNNIPEEEEQK